MATESSNNPARRWRDIREQRVLREDDDVLVLDKPAGMAVLGDNTADDLLALARAAGEDLRPVHRIDKVTSGVVLLARNAAAHAALTRQFNERTVEKTYLCAVHPGGLPARGEIDLPLAAGRKNRVRVAGQREAIAFDAESSRWALVGDPAGDRVYPATTRFARLWDSDDLALLAVWPLTGRRHQIRVHLAWIGYPIIGDPLFAAKGEAARRTLLHAWRLAFDAPDGSGRRIEVAASPDAEFQAALPLSDADFEAALASAGDATL
jgi:tRNA pseudouridine32 synthase/23S rRNA pseudouridine746 synthase/23S rRNA pseudouridine1911/1915/1917 synthase